MTTAARSTAWISLFTAATLLCYSTYSLFDAIIQAHSSGLVEVMSRSRGKPRENVPWPHAWAYFIGLFMLSVGFALWLLNEMGKTKTVLPTIFLILFGTTLLLLSGSLASLAGVAGIAALLLAIALTFLVDRRFGRVAGLWFWVILVLVIFAVAFHRVSV